MCNCIAEVNAELLRKGSNTCLSASLLVSPRYHQRVRLEVGKIDARGKPAEIVRPLYCPFCAAPYPGPQELADAPMAPLDPGADEAFRDRLKESG